MEIFYFLNCFHSNRTLNKLKKHGNVCNDHDYRHVNMLEEGKKILKYSPSDIWRYIIKSSIYNSYRFKMFAKKKSNLVKIILKIITQREKLR